MEARPLRVVLVDDHEMVLQGLKAMLARFLGRIRVVGEAADAETAERVVAALDPDLVLCDVRLRGSSGLDLCKRLVEAEPRRRVAADSSTPPSAAPPATGPARSLAACGRWPSAPSSWAAASRSPPALASAPRSPP
jgi:CheY-like chemotaxis protein